jgi:hypothetical protein
MGISARFSFQILENFVGEIGALFFAIIFAGGVFFGGLFFFRAIRISEIKKLLRKG